MFHLLPRRLEVKPVVGALPKRVPLGDELGGMDPNSPVGAASRPRGAPAWVPTPSDLTSPEATPEGEVENAYNVF